MKIKVKFIDNSFIELDILPELSLEDFKKIISEKSNIPASKQKLIYRGKPIQSTDTFLSLQVTEGDVFHVIVSNNENVNQQASEQSERRPSLLRDFLPHFFEHFTQIMSTRRVNRRFLFQQNSQNLVNRVHYNSKELLEVLRQNLFMIDKLYKFKTPLSQMNLNEKDISSFNLKNNFNNIGDWVDVKDTNSDWHEAQITKLNGNKAFIHYNGWGPRWDEWIEIDSPRITMFRTHTVQLPTSQYLSCFPNVPVDSDNHEIPEYNCEISKMIIDVRNSIKSLLNILDIFLENISKEDKTMVNISQSSKTLCGQISPMMDRVGRIMVDLSGLLYKMKDIGKYIDEANNPDFNPNIRVFTENHNNFNLDTQLEVPVLSNNGDVNVASSIIDRFVIGDNPFIELHINARNMRDNANLPQRATNQNLNLFNSDSPFSIAPRNKFVTTSTQTCTMEKEKQDKSIIACIEKFVVNDCTQTEKLESRIHEIQEIQTEIDMNRMTKMFDVKMVDKMCIVKPLVNNNIDFHLPTFSINTLAPKPLIISNTQIKKHNFISDRKIFKSSIQGKNINLNEYLTNQPVTIQRSIVPANFRVTTKIKPFIGNFIINKSIQKRK